MGTVSCCLRASSRRVSLLAGGALVLVSLGLLVQASVAAALSAPQIYWANEGSGTIGRANLDGTGVNQSFIAGGSGITGVVVDGQHIYWTNQGSGTIGRANLNGTGVNQSFITGGNEPFGVAVDGEHIYWGNYGNGTIGEANLDGTGVNQSFISGASNPLGLAIDGQHLYWANGSDGTIGRANLDGTGVNQSFISGAGEVTGVGVDGQHIYWANFNSGTIGEANLDGTGVNQSFISGASEPYGVAVESEHLYWTNRDKGTIGEANLDGTGVNESFVSGASEPERVAVSVPVAQVTPASPVTFGTTPQGTLSAPQTLKVENLGQQNLLLSGLSLTGADPGDFVMTASSCVGSIAPEGTCQLEVSFAPQAQGALAATLLITSNDYANSPQQVLLSGSGIAALTPTPTTFPSVTFPSVTSPIITGVGQSASTWREGSKLADISRKRKKKPPVGTTFSFSLNEQAAISFSFTQRLAGHKVRGKCVAQTKRNRHKPDCKRSVTQATVSFTGHSGTNKVVFQGRVSRSKKLKPGRYTLVISATNSAGARSAPKSLSFTIVK